MSGDAREARYAEAIDNVTFGHSSRDADWLDEVARAVRIVADAEVAAAASEAQAERDRLTRWKAEATVVILGLQDLGRALNLPLGFRITGEDAAEAARRLVADRDASRDAHGRAIAQMSEWIARAESAEAEVERLRAATTGDDPDDRYDPDWETSPIVRRAPVSSGEAAHMGDSTDAADTTRPYPTDNDHNGETP